MSTGTTFEDRLLDELKREIELREADAGSGEAGPGSVEADTSVRRRYAPLVTPRRIAVVAATCAAAWLAMVAVPGSPADSTAYAVERHAATAASRSPSRTRASALDAQRELAGKVRPWGIR